ncbi:hypothetical protein LZZ85_17860 [Terrimonas sp. NA20]|uniref:Uncharacterized protein n=1 Tax=Terrimonas ginsenosidimutans TaxID=2908004 RepID=A0ABS9KV49_9BACT|nr:hypothetical protein [Terrimonas ginsenosidimutans]MCG2616168.1 hypothetical protein [Terrimonas ginsenosidimutans]
MGQGPTIQELADKDTEFRKYLAQINDEVQADKTRDIDSLKEKMTEFYKEGGWNDHKPIMQLDKVEVQQVSSWSLDNVTKMITAVKDAIFGNSEPPDGVQIEKPAELLQSVAQMSNLGLMVMNKAFSAIQGILQAFATESSYKGSAIQRIEVIAPGLTLFISIRSDVWRSKGFFNNDSIAQYLFVIRSQFSLKQAGDLADYNALIGYQEVHSAFVTRLKALAKVIADPATPYRALLELEEEMGYYAEQISELQAMINALSSEKIRKHLADAKGAIHERRRAAALQEA